MKVSRSAGPTVLFGFKHAATNEKLYSNGQSDNIIVRSCFLENRFFEGPFVAFWFNTSSLCGWDSYYKL